MNRRALILEELQLAPLWVRRELLQTQAETPEVPEIAPASVEVADNIPGQESNAHHPLPAVARAANKALAPLIDTSTKPKANTAEIAQTQAESQAEDSRSRAIASMSWEELQNAVAQCSACTLCQSRTQTVFGTGNPQASLVVVGEAPGEEEDRQGEPFVGRAGKLLDNMLAAIQEKRGERVFIANVLKCRPPGNRNPTPEEVKLCTPFLLRQLELIGPRAILATGRFAAHALLHTEAPLSALREKRQQWNSTPLVVTYHPAYLLRNLPDKSKTWNDLLQLQEILGQK